MTDRCKPPEHLRSFPILGTRGGVSVPWEFVAPHEAQAYKNHFQTLKRLAERGGLSWCELRAVIESRPWRAGKEPDDIEAVQSAVTRWETRKAIDAGEVVAAEITTLRARVETLEAVIKRLGSSEAFVLAGPIDPEMLARIEYARAAMLASSEAPNDE